MTDNINTDMIAELKQLMEDDFSLLLETFISDADSRVSAIETALVDRNSEQVRELAHAFKGSSANLGAVKLSELCYALENIGREARLDDAPSVLNDISSEYQVVKDYFNSLI